MGKRIVSQRRGRGTLTYRSHSFRHTSDVKYRYDILDKNTKAIIIDLIHCVGHTAPLALVKYEDGQKGYLLVADGIKVSDTVLFGPNIEIINGYVLPLKNIPVGTSVFNIEKVPGDGGRFVRAAGTNAKILVVEDKGILVQMPSKGKKLFNPNCRATIGLIAGSGRTEKPFVKAGNRWHKMKARGRLYPITSGVAMNATDHPFGSGRGRHPGKPTIAPRFAPPGRKVGKIRPSRTGKRK